MKISTKKLVNRLFVNIDIFENTKTEIPDIYQIQALICKRWANHVSVGHGRKFDLDFGGNCNF